MQLMIDTETGRSKGYGFITVKKKNLSILWRKSFNIFSLFSWN
jgi:hypothetical protein